MKILKKTLKAIIILILVAISGFAGIIFYAIISDYKPAEKVTVAENMVSLLQSDSAEYSLMTWNIGYCGLDKDMDFFYDGGTKVMTPIGRCLENLAAVKGFLRANDSLDFIFIQEVDKSSKRSYHINEFDTLAAVLNGHRSFFATNYDVFFVPVPPASPMGKVLSGLAVFSKAVPTSSVRYSFPGEYGFPKQLFMLDRCFLVNRYPVRDGHDIVIINTHNEAFDTGEIRRKQMAYMKDFILGEYAKGNWVIIGGDWNQTPPGYVAQFPDNKADTASMAIPSDFLPDGWRWVYDNSSPSNRSVVTAYDPASTPTTILDFFLVSPNIETFSVNCIHLGFANSDHNPVIMKIRLK